jgi:hypothetical protein
MFFKKQIKFELVAVDSKDFVEAVNYKQAVKKSCFEEHEIVCYYVNGLRRG